MNRGYNFIEYPIDQINAFRSSGFRASPIANPQRITKRGLFNTIKTAIGTNAAQSAFVSLTYVNRVNQRLQSITVNPNYLDNYEDFNERIDDIAAQGGQIGSGVIGDEDYDLLLDQFVVRYVKTDAFGRADDFLFNIEDVNGGEKDECVARCLEKMGYDLTDHKYYIIERDASGCRRTIEWQGETYIGKVVNKKGSKWYGRTFITSPLQDEKTGMLGCLDQYLVRADLIKTFHGVCEFLLENRAAVDIIANNISILPDSNWRERPTFWIQDPKQGTNGAMLNALEAKKAQKEGRSLTADEIKTSKCKKVKLTQLLDTDIREVKLNAAIPLGVKGITKLNETLTWEDDIKTHKLVYCQKTKHLDLIKDEREDRVETTPTPILDNIFISRDMRIFKRVRDLKAEKDERESFPDVPPEAFDEIWTYKCILTPKQIFKMQKETLFASPTVTTTYIYLDYETITAFKSHSVMRPYSLSVLLFTPKDRRAPDEDPRFRTSAGYGEYCTNNIRKMADELKTQGHHPNLKCFVGWDCTEQFVKKLLDIQRDGAEHIFQFVTFNGTNFDNIIFVKDLLELEARDAGSPDFHERLNVSDIFYNGNQLINFKLNGRHSTFDLAKYLNGSLKANCESFKIPEEYSKKGFDHDYVQKLFDDGELDAMLADPTCNFYKQLVEYNNYDVISLALIHISFKAALGEIECVEQYIDSLEHNFKTIGSLIWRIFTDHIKKVGVHLPYLDYELYTDIQRYKVAGRVELFNGPDKIEETVASLDACSEYPTQMAVAPNWFPVGINPVHHSSRDDIEKTEIAAGNYIRSSKWVDPPDENSTRDDDTRLAWYYCTFNQTGLRERLNIPNIYPEKIFGKDGVTIEKNNWASKNDLVDYFLPNVVIKRLLDKGVKVTINQEKKGIIFQAKEKNIKLFRPILDFMKGKNEQDVMKREKSPGYNCALREMYKLLMNSLSGKVIEKLHVEKTQEVDVYKYLCLEQDVAMNQLKSITAINIVGSRVFATTEAIEEKLIKSQRPIYIAALIYAYAHRDMSNQLYDRIGMKELIYTDTDAAKCRAPAFAEWRKWAEVTPVPHWPEVEAYDERYRWHMLYSPNSKVFGSYENELDTENDLSYWSAPKQYLVTKKDPRGYHPHMSFKGVKPQGLLLDVVGYAVLDGGVEQMAALPFVTNKEVKISGEEDKTETRYSIIDDTAAYYWAREHQHLSVGNNYTALFEQLHTHGEAHILCTSFSRNIKNTARKVGLEDTKKFNQNQNTISLSQMIKRVRKGPPLKK